MYQKFFKGCNWLTSVSDSGIPGWSGHKKGRTEARPGSAMPRNCQTIFQLNLSGWASLSCKSRSLLMHCSRFPRADARLSPLHTFVR